MTDISPAEWEGVITCIVLLVATAWVTDRVTKRRKREGER